MSNDEVFDKLYQEINRQNTFYFWIIGIVAGMIPTLVAIFFYFQWRLSDSQVKKIKVEIENNISQKYNLVELNKEVDNIMFDNAVTFYSRIDNAFDNLNRDLAEGKYNSGTADNAATSIYNSMLYVLSSLSISSNLKQRCFEKTKQHMKMLEAQIEKLPDGSKKDKWKILTGQINSSLELLNKNTNWGG